jgi:hypothetical protein
MVRQSALQPTYGMFMTGPISSLQALQGIDVTTQSGRTMSWHVAHW